MAVAKIVPVWQYHAAVSSGTSYMFSQNPTALQGWTPDGIAFYAFATADGGGVPVYEYSYTSHSNGNGTTYIYSTNPALSSSLKQVGVAWYAFGAASPGLIPIYEYSFTEYAGGPTLFALSSSTDFGPGWKNIDTAFYTVAPEKAVAPDYGLMLDADSNVTMPCIDEYNISLNDFSVTAMFQTGEPGTLVSRKPPYGGGRTQGGWLVAIVQGGKIVFATDNGLAYYVVESGQTDALDDRWHGVAAVRRNGQLEIWLDGVQLSTTVRATAGTPLTLSSPAPLMIGGTATIQHPYNAFYGTIEDVTVWNCAISASQMTEAMFNLLTGQEQGLVGFWKLDNSLADSSPLNNGGTANGDVSFVPVFHATWVQNAPNAFSFATVSNLVTGQTNGAMVTRTQTLSVAAGAPFLVVCVSDPDQIKFPAGVGLTIWDPQGRIYNQAQDTQTLYVAMSGSSVRYMVVVDPMPGEWIAQINAPASTPFVLWFQTLPSADLVQTMTNALAPVYGLNPGGKRAKRGLAARAEQQLGVTLSKTIGVIYIIGGIGVGAFAIIAATPPATGAAPIFALSAALLLSGGAAQLWSASASQANLTPAQAADQAATTAGFTANGKPVLPPLNEVYESVIQTVGTPATTSSANFASRKTMGVGADYYLHLDVWGEGPSFVGFPAGFKDALNVNVVDENSQTRQSISMLVQVGKYETQFPFANGTFNYITLQGAPLTTSTASEIARMLAPGGRVGLWFEWTSGDNLANAQYLAGLLSSAVQYSCSGPQAPPAGATCSSQCVDEFNGEYSTYTKICIVNGRKS